MGARTRIREGYELLWGWFGLSYASFITIPRVLAHEMPDKWQRQMAKLLEEYDETWNGEELPSPYVSARQDNKFTSWPDWLLNYRHPDRDAIETIKRKRPV